MDFGFTIKSLKEGKKVRRKAWRNPRKHLWLKEESGIKAEWCKDPKLKSLFTNRNEELKGLRTICMYDTHHDDGIILTGWLPTAIDIFAEDWEVVE